MKLHLAIDENSKEIEASTLTDHTESDDKVRDVRFRKN